MKNLRYTAATIIDAVTQGESLTARLDEVLPNIKEARDRSFVQAICYGVCRFYDRLDILLSYLLQVPMKAKDSDVHALLLVGLYQLTDMRVPAHAAVAETVNATEKFDKPWARGFVNAILREYLRQQEALTARLEADEEAHYSHAAWWIECIKAAYPDNWQQILVANNEHPPLSIRVNATQLSRDEYLAKLEAHHPAKAIPHTTHGIQLEKPAPVESLPGFGAGQFSVQDGAAQLAVTLLDLQPGQTVLDACAAPGGKLMHILETEPKLAKLVAVELVGERIHSIEENLVRLKLENKEVVKIHCADIKDVHEWSEDMTFDRILLDAPCSASGVIRRHPDIKLLREEDDIEQLADEQFDMLKALWPLLKPDGLLVYATCSVFPEENVELIKSFVRSQQDAEAVPMDVSWGHAREMGRQILPGDEGMDGFYFAVLKKAG